MNKVSPITVAYRPDTGDGEPPRPLRRPLPPPEEFPVDALGDILGGAALAIHDRVQAPLALCAQSVLATATLAVQHLADVEMPGGRRKPLSEFFVTIAESGERKTTADEEATWCVRRREELLGEDYAEAVFRYENELKAWESERNGLANDKQMDRATRLAALDNLGHAPKAPLKPIIVGEDPTPEGLMRALGEGQPSMAVFSSEGGRFIGGHGMNEDNRLKTATTLSSMWDGSPIKRILKGDGSLALYGRRVSMHLMIQPVLAPQLLGDEMLAGQGLLSRTLVVAPESAVGTRFWREPNSHSHQALSRFSARCLDAFETPAPTRPERPDELEPRPLPMTEMAERLWIRFSDHVEVQLGPDGLLAPIRAWGAKQAEHAVRLAGVLALVDDLDTTTISDKHMEGGIRLSEHYATESLRLYMAGHDDPMLVLAEKVLKWLNTEWARIQRDKGHEPLGYVSCPDLYQYGPNAIRSAEKARKVMGTLESHGWATKQDHGAVVLGAKKREAWLVTQVVEP
jgi:hypothetical protein